MNISVNVDRDGAGYDVVVEKDEDHCRITCNGGSSLENTTYIFLNTRGFSQRKK